MWVSFLFLLKEHKHLTRLTTGFMFLIFTGSYVIFIIFSTSPVYWSTQYIFKWADELESNIVVSQKFFQQWKDSSCHLHFEFGGRVYRDVIRSDNSTVAGIDGQKAVCLDPGLAPPPGMCVVYSFGLSDDWSFDSAMASYGCDVYSFDPSIQHPTMPNNSQRIHYFNMGLGTINSRKDPRGEKTRNLPTVTVLFFKRKILLI